MPVYSSAAESFPLDIQEGEENFDLALIASLEIDVVPHLGGSRVPDDLVAQLGKILQRGSKFYEVAESDIPDTPGSPAGNTAFPPTSIPKSPPPERRSSATKSKASHQHTGSASKLQGIDINTQYSDLGSTDFGTFLPRERFSYWCFDLLFLICSDVTRGVCSML